VPDAIAEAATGQLRFDDVSTKAEEIPRLDEQMTHLNQSVHNELTKLRELIERKGMMKRNENGSTRSWRNSTKLLTKSKPNPGDRVLRRTKSEIAEMRQQIIVLEQRIEESKTIVMTHVHREQTNALVSKEELMVSLVPHVDVLRSKMEGLKGDWEDLTGLKKDLKCIKYEVKNET
jgi:hypothetical protein